MDAERLAQMDLDQLSPGDKQELQRFVEGERQKASLQAGEQPTRESCGKVASCELITNPENSHARLDVDLLEEMYPGRDQQLNTGQERVGVLAELRWPFCGCQQPDSQPPVQQAQLDL